MGANGIDSATNIATWLGIVVAGITILGVMFAAWRRLWSWVIAYWHRPRIAKPEFCKKDGKGVIVTNTGKSALDIESVRFDYVDDRGTKYRIALTSEQDEPIPAKRKIDCDDMSPQWQRFYYFPKSNLDETIETSFALTSNPKSWKIEIWVRNRNKPIWSGTGDDLNGLLALVNT